MYMASDLATHHAVLLLKEVETCSCQLPWYVTNYTSVFHNCYGVAIKRITPSTSQHSSSLISGLH